MSTEIVQTLVDGLSVGGLYALTALGIGLIFSVMRLGNFAHSEFITVAAYVLFALSGQPLVMSISASVLLAIALAVLTERVGFRPLRNADPATLLISSFTVSMFLQRLMIFLIGSRPKAIDPLPHLGDTHPGDFVPLLPAMRIAPSEPFVSAFARAREANARAEAVDKGARP